MSTPEQRRTVYGTARWKRTRAAVLARDGFLCSRCLAAGRTVPARTVHHKARLDARPDLAFEPDNLECLCNPCHEAEHAEEREPGGVPGRRAWDAFVGELTTEGG